MSPGLEYEGAPVGTMRPQLWSAANIPPKPGEKCCNVPSFHHPVPSYQSSCKQNKHFLNSMLLSLLVFIKLNLVHFENGCFSKCPLSVISFWRCHFVLFYELCFHQSGLSSLHCLKPFGVSVMFSFQLFMPNLQPDTGIMTHSPLTRTWQLR